MPPTETTKDRLNKILLKNTAWKPDTEGTMPMMQTLQSELEDLINTALTTQKNELIEKIEDELDMCKFQTEHSGYVVPFSSIEKVLSTINNT